MRNLFFAILALLLVVTSCQKEQVQPEKEQVQQGEVSPEAFKGLPIIQITGNLHRKRGENSHGACSCESNCGGICGVHGWILGFQVFRTGSSGTGPNGEIHFYATAQREANSEGSFYITFENLK